MKRGRPRHDDVLTPREWQVLALLREGLGNEAIAARLGISLDTAKYHVSEILGKLGVGSREEAARWQGEPRRGVAWWLAPWAKWPLAVVTLSGIVLLSLLVTGVTRGGSENGDGPAAATGGAMADFAATPAATATPAAASQRGVEAALELTVCIDDYAWTRPSLEQQIAHIEADRRYAPFDDIRRSEFEAFFYISAGPGTGRGNPMGKMVLFSGLWTLDNERDLAGELSAGCPDAPNMFSDPELIDLFLFYCGATAAHWDGARTVITVEARPAGFQAVQLRYPRPAGEYAGAFVFVDASGRTLGVIEQNAFWSTAP